MANALSKSLPNTAASAEVTGGSVDNIKLLASGQSDIGFSMVDAAWDGVNGTGKFKQRCRCARWLSCSRSSCMW